jgi:uncharacterized protein (DUF2345 family)
MQLNMFSKAAKRVSKPSFKAKAALADSDTDAETLSYKRKADGKGDDAETQPKKAKANPQAALCLLHNPSTNSIG